MSDTPAIPVPAAAPPAPLLPARSRRKWPGLLLGLALGVAAVSLSLRYRRPEPVAPPHAAGVEVDAASGSVRVQPGAPQWRVLKLGVVEKAAGGYSDPVPGRVRIDDRLASKIGTPLNGRVSAVMVDLGQKVEPGDPLFAIASPDVAELRAQRKKALVDLDASRVVLERVKAMVEGRALPAKEELAAEQQLKQAEVGLELAEAKLNALHIRQTDEALEDEFLVVSPRAGVVVEKNLVASQEVNAESTPDLLVVADLSVVQVVADLFEDQASLVGEGSQAEVTLSRVSRAPLAGTVSMISAVVDPSRHTVPVRVRVPNPEGLLRPNAYASVRFSIPVAERAVQIPSTAIVSDGAHQYVYVRASDQSFQKREVVVGASSGGRVLLLDGLREGETVLIEGGILLENQVLLGG